MPEEEQGDDPKKPEGEKDKQPEKPQDEEKPGDSPASSPIERAQKAADRLDAINTKTEELLKRLDSANVDRILSGSANAGMVPKKESESEKLDREANEIMKQTGLPLDGKD